MKFGRWRGRLCSIPELARAAPRAPATGGMPQPRLPRARRLERPRSQHEYPHEEEFHLLFKIFVNFLIFMDVLFFRGLGFTHTTAGHSKTHTSLN